MTNDVEVARPRSRLLWTAAGILLGMPRCAVLWCDSQRMTLSRLDVVVDANADERFDNTLNASSPTTALRQVHRECGQHARY